MNCVHARSESHTPLFAGQRGYSFRLDEDGDGLACEVGEN
ncbi:excalibur calcium-binding domain-containing protein [Nocardia carnea]|uniref:Excalibur calcium-binding domain-containing protein n=1 Tax=Nocardia carnea TaxID=37328 RepID=A0ABW7TVZ4_9NOCA|nr:excalibur calcium-binding domain-containing protein [Nocardia carnea]